MCGNSTQTPKWGLTPFLLFEVAWIVELALVSWRWSPLIDPGFGDWLAVDLKVKAKIDGLLNAIPGGCRGWHNIKHCTVALDAALGPQ